MMLEFANDKNTLEFNRSTSRDRIQKQFKLPSIQRVVSRGHPKDNTKHISKLPSLKLQQLQKTLDTTDRKPTEEDDLVGQVQRRLKFIMQEQNITEIQQSDEQDNFQKKINENKELIKKIKKRNQEIKQQNDVIGNNMRFNQHLMKKFSSNKYMNQNLQKRFREIRQIPLENKLVNKRKELASLNKNNHSKEQKLKGQYQKEFISQKHINVPLKENLLKENKSKEELNFNANPHKIMPNLSYKVNNLEQKKIINNLSQKSLPLAPKNQLLFDVIHNYLDNPKKIEQQLMNNNNLRKQKGQLEQKLKSYELKLQNLSKQNGVNQTQLKKEPAEDLQKDKENQSKVFLSNSSEHNKIRINERMIFDQSNSTFQKEMERINQYTEKNQKSLEKYIQNQKILYGVKMVSNKNKNREKSCPSEKELI